MPLETAWSRRLMQTLSASAASFLSPAAIATRTRLSAPRAVLRKCLWCSVIFAVRRTRLRADSWLAKQSTPGFVLGPALVAPAPGVVKQRGPARKARGAEKDEALDHP